MVKAIDRKLLRDLGQLKGQVITIALVVACGVATYVTLRSTYDSLVRSRDAYYLESRFGDVFAHLKRAPEPVKERLEAIAGVAQVYPRIVEAIRLPIPGGSQPPIGEIVSLPANGEPPLGVVRIESGRAVVPGHSGEAILLTSFARRYHLVPGDRLPAVINGERQELRIVGLGSSPEFVYPIAPGGAAGVDDERFAVLWMDRREIAPSFQMEGAFNDVVIRLEHGASEAAVLHEVDRLLDPYGGVPAVGRARQSSNYILNEELGQLRIWATIVPLIFLAVSAFLVNVVLSRLVYLQRPEIAILKAVGYGDAEVGLHYLKLVTVVVLLGAAAGLLLGAWLGVGLTNVYARVFRFPSAQYGLSLSTAGFGVLLSFGAAASGALLSVRTIALLPPAEAMRPPAPAVYRPLIADRLRVGRLVTPGARMVVRELERRPFRTALSVVGIATGMAILIVGQFSGDAFAYLLDVQFSRVNREDLQVSFRDPLATRAVRSLAHLPGVQLAEPLRSVPIRVEVGTRYREVPLLGLPERSQLRHIQERGSERFLTPPDEGLLLNQTLGELLGAAPGDTVVVKVLEGERRTYRLKVAGVVDEMIGLQAYMSARGVARLLDEPPAASSALLSVSRDFEGPVIARLNDMPAVTSVSSRRAMIATWKKQSGESMEVVTLVLTIFAATIAIGVVYNNARVALAMRARDLASLRVLGFTRAEISRILLGELGFQVLLAIPAGWLLGTWLTGWMIRFIHPEMFRFPLVLSTRTYAVATLVVIAASAASALLVRQRLDRLDLIGVLKTRE